MMRSEISYIPKWKANDPIFGFLFPIAPLLRCNNMGYKATHIWVAFSDKSFTIGRDLEDKLGNAMMK